MGVHRCDNFHMTGISSSTCSMFCAVVLIVVVVEVLVLDDMTGG